MTAVDPLLTLKQLTDQLHNNEFESREVLIRTFRQQKALLAELPSVFEAALETILERMESTALFDEESCSFSQSDMLMALSVWLDKATSWMRKQSGMETG